MELKKNIFGSLRRVRKMFWIVFLVFFGKIVFMSAEEDKSSISIFLLTGYARWVVIELPEIFQTLLLFLLNRRWPGNLLDDGGRVKIDTEQWFLRRKKKWLSRVGKEREGDDEFLYVFEVLLFQMSTHFMQRWSTGWSIEFKVSGEGWEMC